MKHKLLIYNAKEIVLITTKNVPYLLKNDMKKVEVRRQAEDQKDGYSIAIGNDGKILAIDSDNIVNEKFQHDTFENSINAQGMTVLPGLIDGHTHPVWAGDRTHEFSMKLAGATYMEIHKAGGGIHFTVDHTRQTSEEDLLKSFMERTQWMLKCGTTTMEAKSGYGLDVESELKMLSVLEKAKSLQPVEISSTYCGAHAVPKGQTADQATENILRVQLPTLKKKIDEGELAVENIDVFCEEGVFSIDQTRQIVTGGQNIGLAANFHGDELHPTSSAELGAELKARAISHLEKISATGMKAMADSGSVAVVLPTTAYILRLHPPPVREMLEAGIPVALGSDFNPNAFCYSMPMVMHLACVLFHMSLDEALIASTINAAASIGRGLTHGALQVGRQGDIILLDVPKWEHLIYQFGCHDKLIKAVIKNGDIVYKRSD